jgi:glycosyltransferase involved in cell wall biosynthesis
LIDLFSKINSFSFNLLIVGSGPEEKILKNRINELGLSEKIILLGEQEDVFALMTQSHCFLLPSLREGLPLTILESAYAKLPVITSSIISLQNLISKDEGYVVPFNQFEETIYLVVNNYSQAEEKSKRFYVRAKNDFNILKCSKNHEQLYRFVLNA